MNKQELISKLDYRDLWYIVDECNALDNSLEDYRMYNFNEDFLEARYSNNVMKLVRAANCGEIKWTDEYVKVDTCGNIKTLSENECEQILLDNAEKIIDTAIFFYKLEYIDLEQLSELFDEYLLSLK